MPLLISEVGWTIIVLSLCGGAFAIAAAFLSAPILRRSPDPPPAPLPAVTILKPLHGDEPGLEAALASFLTQDYAAPVQIVFGMHDLADPSRAVVERLKRRFPDRDIAVAADPRLHGSNRKVSNLINMMPFAKHDVLVLVDSDITASPDYLRTVVAALSRPGIGAVSCLYAGDGLTTIWSRLAAMGISYHFLPNVLVGIASGLAHPCFGSTVALRRETLRAIGGFQVFSSLLADDFMIGRAVRATGLTLAYPALTVSHGCAEASLGDLVGHELRWARTIRVIDPAGHWGSLITHALPIGLIGAALLGFSPASCAVLTILLSARLFLKARIDRIVGSSAGPFWLLPVRDVLSFGLFIASLAGNTVQWGGKRHRVAKSGAMSLS